MDKRAFYVMQLAELEADVRSLDVAILANTAYLKADARQLGMTEEMAECVLQTALADMKTALGALTDARAALQNIPVAV